MLWQGEQAMSRRMDGLGLPLRPRSSLCTAVAARRGRHRKGDRTCRFIIWRSCAGTVVTRIAAAFEPIYEASLDETRTNANRGPMRHYIQLPLAAPFYQSAFLGDPAIIGRC